MYSALTTRPRPLEGSGNYLSAHSTQPPMSVTANIGKRGDRLSPRRVLLPCYHLGSTIYSEIRVVCRLPMVCKQLNGRALKLPPDQVLALLKQGLCVVEPSNALILKREIAKLLCRLGLVDSPLSRIQLRQVSKCPSDVWVAGRQDALLETSEGGVGGGGRGSDT